jgi:geranylgeranyl pyrophosphate synthase
MDNLKNFFSKVSELVDEKLDELIPHKNIEPKILHQAIRWSIFAGGKRFRPALVLAIGNVFNVEKKRLLNTASAVEMIHTYSLIHDDLPSMDNDDLRRGRETCHVKFDEATAILAGDVLQTMAFQTISDDENLPFEIRVKIISELAKNSGTPNGMVAGQFYDIEAEGKTIDIQKLKQIHQNKTGALIRFSAYAGAIIGNATNSELLAIKNYAENLGLLFQITDDLLDVTQTSEILGKTAGKDLVAEKATYPSIYGIEETQNLATKVYNEAISNLKNIDKSCEILSNIAKFILLRKS